MIALFRDYVIGNRMDITSAPTPIVFAPSGSLRSRSAITSKRDFLHVRRALVITEVDSHGNDEPIALAYVRAGSQVLFRTLPELSEVE